MENKLAEVERKLAIAKWLSVSNVSKNLKYIPKRIIKRSFERIKRDLVNKYTAEKIELLAPVFIKTRPALTPGWAVVNSSSWSTSLPPRRKNISSATTLVNTIVNTRTKSRSKK